MNPTINYSTPARNLKLASRGSKEALVTQIFGRVIGGQCEKHGVVNKDVPGNEQYKHCDCFRGMELKCVYCPPNASHEEIVGKSILPVYRHPYRPDELLVVCDQFECKEKFKKEFSL